MIFILPCLHIFDYISDMSVDKFGHYSSSLEKSANVGIQGTGFKRTKDGHFNVENKRLVNLARPTDDTDACTKHFVLTILDKYHKKHIPPVKTSIENITAEVKIINNETIPNKMLKLTSDIQSLKTNTNMKVLNVTKVIPGLIDNAYGKMREDLKLFIIDKSKAIQNNVKTSISEEVITIQSKLRDTQEKDLKELKNKLQVDEAEFNEQQKKNLNLKFENIIKVIPGMIDNAYGKMRKDLKLFITDEFKIIQKDIQTILDAEINKKYITIQTKLLENHEKDINIFQNKLRENKAQLIEQNIKNQNELVTQINKINAEINKIKTNQIPKLGLENTERN